MTIEEIYSRFLTTAGISTDTRNIRQNSMFVALKGDKFNANTFAAEALEKGAAFVIIDEEEHYVNERTLLVNDSLTALQQLARHHRRQLGLPVIALTGSNGKTTTKELINAVLSSQYKTSATVGNLNNHIGVPLTLLSFTKETEIGIVEMGANHQREIAQLCDIAEPNFGYITNFGKAHLEGFGGTEGVIKGKSELYDYLSASSHMAFVNLDDPIQEEKTAHLPRFTFSAKNYNCDVHIDKVSANPMVNIEFMDTAVASNLIGIYNAGNISAAIAIGYYFKISPEKIKAAIESYIPANNRSQLLERGGRKIILDAYNANPSSMAAAIENLKGLNDNPRTAILGDMFELGPESAAEHRSIVEMAAALPEINFHFTGPDFFTAGTGALNLSFYKTFEDFKANGITALPAGGILLIKGSRGMALERVLEFV
ncbi:MAG: UDP-N-acetylmuramoyl-tripeptide--D-alanyl-D-alanine ligase [Flavobacterium sp.]